jgi:hypothetical protein
MRTRSTGLGSTELVQKFDRMDPHEDYLIIRMDTVEPVQWKVRVAATQMDVLNILKGLLKPNVIWWVLSGLIVGIFTGFKKAKNPRPLDDF